jgi:threonylcarbamoyladenosine tRNA methylthiotransferase MtaB
MKVSFYNIGCKVNFAEMSTIQENFKKANHDIIPFGEKADAIFIHTCTVTNQADSDCRKTIRKARRDNPEAFIAVLGCYAQLKPDEIAEIEGVDAVLGNEEKFDALELIQDFQKRKQALIKAEGLKQAKFHPACSIENSAHTRIAFKIQDGCDYFCTYCAVAHSRGRSRSMDFAELKNTLIKLGEEGAKEVVLSGINIGEYKSPTGEKFSDVLKLINELDLDYRVRISSIEPNLMNEECLKQIDISRNICKHFHIPLQSGSDSILKKMNRRYEVSTFTNLIEQINSRYDNPCIGIDVICGFPGETEEYFNETYNLLKSLDFSYLHVFTYSDRDIAGASKFPDKTPKDEKKRRTKLLRELSEDKRKAFYQKNLGLTHRIIPETYHSEPSYQSAWTDNYVKIKINSDSELNKEFYNIKITSFEDEYCIGEVI